MALIGITIFALCVTSSIVSASDSKDPNYVSGHDVIVHLFEWKWSDIAKECEEFLGPKGFGGVQVSPVHEHIIKPSRPWWERYQPVSYKLVTRSGNETELANMIYRCNKAGVRIYVDIAINHMCADQPHEVIGTAGSRADPPSRDYPGVPYTKSDFNALCVVDGYYDPAVVRNCELFGLHDLNQGVENVREKIVNFMNSLIDMGVAGFRVDAAKHMWPGDLDIIYSRLHDLNMDQGFRKGARPYIYQEVVDFNGDSIKKSEYTNIAVATEFKYGTEVSSAMRGSNPLKYFNTIGEAWGMLPHRDAIIFIDNHDTQRHGYLGSTLSYKDARQYKMAVGFMLAFPYGNPKLMSSYAIDYSDKGPPADSEDNILSPEFNDDNSCKNDWICEHRWRQIYHMVEFKILVKDTVISEWWDNWNKQIAFSRGNVGFIAINADTYDLKATIHTQLPSGSYCDIISGYKENGKCTGKTVNVDENGNAYIEVLSNDEDGILVIHQNARL